MMTEMVASLLNIRISIYLAGEVDMVVLGYFNVKVLLHSCGLSSDYPTRLPGRFSLRSSRPSRWSGRAFCGLY